MVDDDGAESSEYEPAFLPYLPLKDGNIAGFAFEDDDERVAGNKTVEKKKMERQVAKGGKMKKTEKHPYKK